MMITAILSVVNWLKTYFKTLTIGFTCILMVSVFFMYNLLLKKDAIIAQISNNNDYYSSLLGNKNLANRTLQLTINDLLLSNDSVIQKLNETKKKLNIKDKNLVQAQVIKTEIKDTTHVVIKTKDINFSEELKLNSLTTIVVSRKDSILTAIIDLKNEQTLFIEDKKEYRNKYKTWLSRFLHLDFKKDRIKRFTINNSNELIKVTETRIIEIK